MPEPGQRGLPTSGGCSLLPRLLQARMQSDRGTATLLRCSSRTLQQEDPAPSHPSKNYTLPAGSREEPTAWQPWVWLIAQATKFCKVKAANRHRFDAEKLRFCSGTARKNELPRLGICRSHHGEELNPYLTKAVIS